MAYKTNIASITESGPLTYKQLQQANAQNFNAPTETTEASEYEGLVPTYRAPRKATDYIYEGGERSPLQQSGNGYWGDSMFDNPSASENGYTLEGLTDARANNQPTIAKWAAGATKMLGKAATTWVDGTMGLVYGLVSMPEEGRLSNLWDNDFTNKVSEIDRGLENLLPNYRTTEEQDNMWYQNLGTANLWADSFLKNLGFTVGAMYSGGAWTKALKALGLIQKGLTAGVVGSTISAVNEARMEANNTIHDLRELHYKKLDDTFDQRYNEIINSVTLSDSEKQAAIGELYKNTELQRAKIEDDIANAGAITFWGNTALLSLGYYTQFSKLYARGFKSSKGLSAGINDAVRQEVTKELGDNVVRNAGRYAWENISNGKAIRRGLLNGATEGNEEMAQALISSTAGYTIDPDSPDAYYKSLLDPKAKREVRSLASSIFMGLKDSYLSMDRWEEGAIGFLTGILGMPTVGKVQNSSSETYLGRGHTIGLSGGLFGEITRAHDINRRGQEAVDVMNRYVDKLQNQENHFIRSQSFTNAMDGWAAADNAFEYKNAEDNDDFMAISRFAQTGRLGDLKEMVNQDFDNLSDEELTKIAMYTSPNTTLGEDGTVPNTDENGKPIKGGWRNRADGTLMSDTEEGRAEMRKKLNAKRDKILKEIDRYEDSVETARAISNDGLSEDQINELAWLHWKIGAFAERYDSIKKEQTSFLDALQKGVDGFLNGNERFMLNESTEEGKNIAKAMENLSKFLNALRNSESPIQLARYIKANPKMLEFISEFAYPMLEDTTINVDPQKFEEGIKSLEDITKIADAADSFQKKFKEYREDPLGIAKNREKIDKEKETVRRETDKAQRDSKVDKANVRDLVNAALDGNTNLQDLKDEVVGGSLAELNASVAEYNKNNGEESKSSTTKKVETAENIINTGNAVKNNIQKQVEEGSITQEEADRAKARVDATMRSANSVEEVTDLSGYNYNDPMFNTATDSLPEGASHEDLEKWAEKAAEKDKEIISIATYGLQKTNEALDKIPDSAESSNESSDGTTGHSETAIIPDVQEVIDKQKRLEEERKAKEEAERQRLVLDMSKVSETLKESVVAFHEFIDNLDDAVKEQFIKDLNFIKDRIVRCLEQGLSAKDTINIVTELDQYTNLSKITTLVDSYIVAFTASKKAEIEESKKEEAEVKKAEEKRTNVNTTTESNNNNAKKPFQHDKTMTVYGRTITLAEQHVMSEGFTLGLYKDSEGNQDVIIAAVDEQNYVAFFPEYKNGKPTGNWTSKMEVSNSKMFKAMIKEVEKHLPEDAIITEQTSISLDGLKVWNKFTSGEERNFEFVLDENGNIQRQKVLVNGAAKDNTFAVNEAERGEMPEIIVKTKEEKDKLVDEIKKQYPLIDDSNIYFNRDNTVTVDLPMVRKKAVKIYTPAITIENAKNDANDLNRSLNGNSDDTKRYWKPTTTRIGIHNPKGDNTPYWEVAQILTTAIEKNRRREDLTEQESIYYNAYVKPGYIQNGYSKEELRRMKAVGEYLEKHGVFEYVDNGNVKVGSEVTFFIDSELNTAAGEIVILMKDKNGHIIGDVASPKSASLNKQSGLAQAVKTITEEYESANRPDTFESEKVKTTVARNMIGKVPFTNEYITLNDIFSGDSDGFKLCIALESGKNSIMMMTPNRTQKQGLSEEDKSIMPPLDAKAGQPYVVINTNGSRYSRIAVPIVMEPYNENTANTKLGKRIEAALSKIANADNNTVLPIVDEIEELLGIKGIQIFYNDGNEVVVRLLGHNAEEGDSYAQIYKGSKNADDLVESIKAVLYGTPFQIPRRLLNDPKFNSMVGEIAKTNLPKGATHTINEWFVLNPLNEQGEEVKAKAPKTVGKNTNAIIANAPISLNYNGVDLNVDTKTWEVTDNNGKVYSGPKTDIVKAYAFGMHKLKNMEKPYDTEWGFFDPVKGEFIADTEKTSDINKVSSDSNQTTSDSDELVKLVEDAAKTPIDTFGADILENKTEEVKKEAKPSNSEEILSEEKATSIVKDLLDSDTKKEVWSLLSTEQKSFIARKTNSGFRDTALVKLTAELGDGKFNKDVDTILGIKKVDKPKYRRVEGNSVEGIIDDEVKWLSKALPQFSNDEHLAIVKGVSSLATDDGGYAWGQFSTGLITVAEYASKGTLYHEAFHAVVDTLLTDSEYEELFNLGKELYGNIGDLDIEENLAEDFRRFMQSGSDYYVDYMEAKDVSTPIIRSIVKLFRKLSMLTGILRNNTMYLNKIYSDISRGKYANRVINNSSTSTNTKYRMVEGYEFTVERIQRTVDSVVNNANKTAIGRNKAWGELADSILEDGYKIRGKRINGKWVVTSVTQVNNPRHNERIKQHHRDKLMYGNLSEEDRNYISDRGISIEEYNRMSQIEKEVLFHCKY